MSLKWLWIRSFFDSAFRGVKAERRFSVTFDESQRIASDMKKVLTFSLIVLLASPMFVGCKSGTSCFTRNGSRVPVLGSSSSDYSATPVVASTGTPVVNAYPTNEVMMMNAASAYSQCEPCAPAQTQCNPCDPCSPSGARVGTTASGYPAGSYSGL